MSQDNSNSDVGYWEFMLPAKFQGEDELSYITIDFNVTEWFRDKYTGYDGDDYPPSNRTACDVLARHFENNHEFYFENGLVYDAMESDHGISDPTDLKEHLDAGNIKFIYRVH